MRMISAFLLLGLFAKIGATAEASVLSVSPTRLFVTPSTTATSIKLKNGGDEKALVEVKIFAWTDSSDGNALEPTDDFLVAPPVFEIPPETEQTLRLVPRIDSDLDSERMYRMVLTEVASEVGPVNGVGFAVEMSLPIFMTPDGAKANPVWSFGWKDIGTPELKVANHGDAHLRVRSFEIFDDADKNLIFKSDDAAYVLPGEERAWPLETNFGNPKRPLTLKALTTKGLIETVLTSP